MKVALVYDRVNKWGGAERVLLALHSLFPDAPLYTSVYSRENASWADVFTVKTSFLQHIPFAKKNHELFAPLMPLAFESFSFDSYDVVISVTSESAKGIITNKKTKHICYMLTPTRYLWSGYSDYFKNVIFRIISWPVVLYLRWWDRIAAQRPDVIISISQEVRKRVKKYYGRESEVVYPPFSLAFSLEASSVQLEKKLNAQKLDAKRSYYFLIVSRLVPYKRIDIAVRVCTELKVPLRIVGSGSEEQNLKKIAGPTVEFVGNLTDKELVEYYKNCRALIFPGKEDFGLSVVEAQHFGKPVIAYKEGGVLETVISGKTGEFFYPQTDRALRDVVLHFEEKKYKAEDCRKQAKKFSIDQFEQDLKKVLEKNIYI